MPVPAKNMTEHKFCENMKSGKDYKIANSIDYKGANNAPQVQMLKNAGAGIRLRKSRIFWAPHFVLGTSFDAARRQEDATRLIRRCRDSNPGWGLDRAPC